jgi:hypothetical protein
MSICICGLLFDVRDYWIKKIESVIEVMNMKELNEV